MATYLAAISKSLFDGSKEPSTELCSTILVLHLFVIFNIVKKDKTRPTTSPLSTSDFLLRTARKYPELVAIEALHYDVGFLVGDEFLDLEIAAEGLVLPQLGSHITKVFDGHLFG